MAEPRSAAGMGIEDMATRPQTTIGRDANHVDLVLSHPSVSRTHAEVRCRNREVSVRDLQSLNGTFVNGRRVTGWTPLAAGDRIDIGPYALYFDGRRFAETSREGNLQLIARRLTRDVRVTTSAQPLRILDDVTIVIQPNEFVCILGASGAGKSTLMNALSGRQPADRGQVLINSVDLYGNFEALKQGIAMVPQHDVLHQELVLRDALMFTARLRLPPDTSSAEAQRAVALALDSVGLADRGATRIGRLSGGQKKRASLANEIVCRPNLLFLDEVTSGLDEGIDWEIMRLLRSMTRQSMTIICVTHTLANVEEFCHKVVVMAPPGVLAFYGSPTEALDYFQVRKLGELYRALSNRTGAEWARRFQASPFQREYIRGFLPPDDIETPAAPRHAAGTSPTSPLRTFVRQFPVLSERYLRTVLADWQTLAIALVQPTLVAILVSLVFANTSPGDPGQFGLIFFLGLSSFWYGCNNASKEIVKERSIYLRERDVNLSIPAFLASKITILWLIGIIQVLVLAAIVSVLSFIPGDAQRQILRMIVAMFAGTGMGLLLSASADTTDQANTLVPIALIPQVVLGGLIVSDLPPVPDAIAHCCSSGFWMYTGVEGVILDNDGDAFWGPAVLFFHGVFYLLAAGLVMAWRDSRGGAKDWASWLRISK